MAAMATAYGSYGRRSLLDVQMQAHQLQSSETMCLLSFLDTKAKNMAQN
jgi:hypothetical protein